MSGEVQLILQNVALSWLPWLSSIGIHTSSQLGSSTPSPLAEFPKVVSKDRASKGYLAHDKVGRGR
jgi:hypothetical protein